MLVSLLPAHAQVILSTPMDHYESFDAGFTGLTLLNNLMSRMDPAGRLIVQQFMAREPRERFRRYPAPMRWRC
jgi:hypothetical protein